MPDLQDIQAVLELLLGLPVAAAYGLIAAGSALENIFPPVPSDTFVVLGAVLTDRGSLQPLPVLLSAWIANTGGAMCVFSIARRRGPTLFETGWARWLLRPHQFDRVSRFYERYGLWAIFFSRFLPVLRVVIPTFAGFTGLGAIRTLLVIASASLLWNGFMLWAGIFASRNIGRLLEFVGQANAWLLAVAVVAIGGIVWWWLRSRREDGDESPTAPVPGADGGAQPAASDLEETPAESDRP